MLIYTAILCQLCIDTNILLTTEHQSKTGQTIQQEKLRAGDLVFFKTGIFTRHVGMYMDKGNFLHVSTSKGVMVSNLEDLYWSDTYWKANRVQ